MLRPHLAEHALRETALALLNPDDPRARAGFCQPVRERRPARRAAAGVAELYPDLAATDRAVAATIVIFVIAYIVFQRQEIRA